MQLEIMHLFLLYTNILMKFADGLSMEKGMLVATKIRNRMKSLFSEITRHEELERKFEKLYQDGVITLDTLNVSKVSETFNTNLDGLIKRHINTMEKLKAKVEELHTNYTEDENIQPFPYLYRQNNPPNPVSLELTFNKEQLVSFNNSHVQVPSDTFYLSKPILNDIKATDGIDEVFIENFREIPSLQWQYFGSENGMFRVYPGENRQWNVTDLYDCRRRLWYNQAINTPKDVLIAVDLSGSMTGNHFDIAKVAIKSFIDTLQQDDFFNVIFVRKGKVGYILPCLKLLAQAISHNKGLVKKAVDELPTPNGDSDMSGLFEEAFDMLHKSKESRLTSAQCTSSIMFLSDGIDHSEELESTLVTLNTDAEVAIFTFIIGEGTHDVEMERIACENGGKFYKFLTMGNVWEGVLQYQKVINIPIAESDSDNVIFTPLYLDSSGLGMMTTISAPAFSETKNGTRRKLIGVAGIDVALVVLELQYPTTKLGVFGHAFAVNNNGLFLIHPKFRDQSGYLPDPATVFLNEIEYTTNSSISLEIMREIIDLKTNCKNAEIDWLFLKDSDKRVVRLNVTYCYQPIKHTPFRTGVVIPVLMQKTASVSKIALEPFLNNGITGLTTLKTKKVVEIAQWPFCNFEAEEQATEPASRKFYPKADEIQEFLYSNAYYTEICDHSMLFPLILASAVISNFTDNFWSSDLLEAKDISQLYVISSSGYITSLSTDEKPRLLNRDIFAEELYAHPISFMAQKQIRSLVFSVPTKHEPFVEIDSQQDVEIAVAATLYMTQQNIVTAVAGMIFSHQLLLDVMLNMSVTNTCMSDTQGCHDDFDCRKNNMYHCYLLDENGYIVSSNQGDKDFGIFLGYRKGLLMKDLVNNSIYEERVFNDTQAKCEEVKFSTPSSAYSLVNIYSAIFHTVIHIAYIMLQLTSSLLYTSVSSSAASDNDGIEYTNVSCLKRISIYTRTKFENTFFGTLLFSSECSQDYLFISLNDTNLAFIVVHNNCLQPPIDHELDNEAKKIDDSSSKCPRILQHRQTVPTCYQLKGDNEECESHEHGASGQNLKLYLTIAGSFSLLIVLIFLLLCT